MKLYELWKVAPTCHVFIKNKDMTVKEYNGTKNLRDKKVIKVRATKYPMYDEVLEVIIK